MRCAGPSGLDLSVVCNHALTRVATACRRFAPHFSAHPLEAQGCRYLETSLEEAIVRSPGRKRPTHGWARHRSKRPVDEANPLKLVSFGSAPVYAGPKLPFGSAPFI